MNVAILNRLERLLKRREKTKSKTLLETINAEIKWTQKLFDEVNKKKR